MQQQQRRPFATHARKDRYAAAGIDGFAAKIVKHDRFGANTLASNTGGVCQLSNQSTPT